MRAFAQVAFRARQIETFARTEWSRFAPPRSAPRMLRAAEGQRSWKLRAAQGQRPEAARSLKVSAQKLRGLLVVRSAP